MFFENHNVYGPERFNIYTSKSSSGAPLHIHRVFELYAVKEGKVSATINNTIYQISAGEAVLIFPYQKHKYVVDPHSEIWVCTFSPELVKSFSQEAVKLPISNKFLYSPPEKKEAKSLLAKKALCYAICDAFNENAEYSVDMTETNDLLLKILQYVSENYTGQCNLKDVCHHIGYNCDYISRLFKKTVGQSLKNYVNDLRISEACRLLRETDMKIERIAEQCGFGTVRSFNITFLNLTEKTPKEYRKEFKS